MKTTTGLRIGVAAIIASAAMACSGEAPEQAPARTGSLEMALQSVGSQGSVFRLAGTFALNDTEQTVATVDELDPSPTLTLNPQVGGYQLSLCEAGSANPLCQSAAPWRLFEVQCVDAADQSAPPQLCQTDPSAYTESTSLLAGVLLTSPNPRAVSILLNQTTYAPFQFFVPGQGTVTFARGTLNIDVSVGEGYPDGQTCSAAVECASNVCEDIDGDGVSACQPATCNDGVQNGGESGADCGGPCSTPCPSACSASTDCPAGESCVSGQCSGSSPGACSASSDCAAGESCVNGQCSGGSSGACTADSQCPAGTVCDAAAQVCVADCFGVICAAGQVCDPTQGCMAGSGSGSGGTCTASSDCPAGTVCDAVAQVCVASGSGASCGDGVVDATEQCDDGNTVSGDGCTPNCTYDSCTAAGGGCAVGFVCDSTSLTCLPGSGQTCTVSTDCSTGNCVNGFCQ